VTEVLLLTVIGGEAVFDEIISSVSRPAIAALELGYRRAYPRTAQKLAKALKVKPEDLT